MVEVGYTHRSTRYRLVPRSRSKHDRLMRMTGACIWVWNRMLARNERGYGLHLWCPGKYGKPSTTFFSLGREFTELRRGTDWLQELPFGPVRYTLKRQAEAWKRYFSGQGGRPKYKSKHRERSATFPEPGHFRIFGDHIRLQRLGWYRIERRGGDPYAHCEARSVTIKRECGKWYAIVLYRVPVSEVESEDDGIVVGVDMNVGQVADSEGEMHRMPGVERLEARRRRYQRKLARQVKGSNRRAVTKARLAKTCRNIRNFRGNWHHHASKRIAAKASAVVVEKLNIKGMTKSAKGDAENPGRNVRQKAGLNRGIRNTGVRGLRRKLEYKAGRVVEVDPKNTSLMCNACGVIDKRNRRTQARFECVGCGHRDNADVNAAKNIRDRGVESLSITAMGTVAAGCGGGGVARPEKRQEIARLAA